MDFEELAECSEEKLESQSVSSLLNNTLESNCSFESEYDESRNEGFNLKPTFKSIHQAKKRLQAFSSADKLKDLYSKDDKAEDRPFHKDKPRKTKSKAKYDEYARSVIKEIELEKRIGAVPSIPSIPSPQLETVETLGLLARSKAILEMYQVRKDQPKEESNPGSPTPDKKDQFKKREIKINKNNLRTSSISFTMEKSPSPDRKAGKDAKPQVTYPRSWAEYKESKMTDEKHARLKGKLYHRNNTPFELSHYYNFGTPSREIDQFRCRSENCETLVPFFHLRCTGTQPKIHYSVNWIKNPETYITKQELYRIVPKERMEIIEKIPTKRKKFSEIPLTIRQWYPKNWKKGDIVEGKLLEKSVGLSFLQTYSDDEENEEIVEDEPEETDQKQRVEIKKKHEEKKKTERKSETEDKEKLEKLQKEDINKTLKEIEELEKKLQVSSENIVDHPKKEKKKKTKREVEECPEEESKKKKKKSKLKKRKKKSEEDTSSSSEESSKKKRKRKQAKKKDKKKDKRLKCKKKVRDSSSSEDEKKTKKKKKAKKEQLEETPKKKNDETLIELELPLEIVQEEIEIVKKKLKKNRWDDVEVKRDNICDEDYMLKEYEYQRALEAKEETEEVESKKEETKIPEITDKKKATDEIANFEVQQEKPIDEERLEAPKKKDKVEDKKENDEVKVDLRQHIEEKTKSRKEKEDYKKKERHSVDLREELDRKRHDKDRRYKDDSKKSNEKSSKHEDVKDKAEEHHRRHSKTFRHEGSEKSSHRSSSRRSTSIEKSSKEEIPKKKDVREERRHKEKCKEEPKETKEKPLESKEASSIEHKQEKRKRSAEKEETNSTVKIKEEPDWENIKSKRKRYLQDEKKDKSKEETPEQIEPPSFEPEKEAPQTEITIKQETAWEREEIRPKPFVKTMNTSWESDEEIFVPPEKEYKEYRSDRRIINSTLDLEIPLNIKPFKRREVETTILDPDRELQLLKQQSKTLSEERRKLEIEKMRVKELEMELIREAGNDPNRTTERGTYKFDWNRELQSITKSARWDKKTKDKVDLTPVKVENDTSMSSSIALENEYEEFMKAVTNSSEKQKKSKRKDTTITISSDSDSFDIATPIKDDKNTGSYVGSPCSVVTNLDELLPKSVANIPLPNEDILPSAPPVVSEIKIDPSSFPIEAKTEDILPNPPQLKVEEEPEAKPLPDVKPVPVPSPKLDGMIDVKKPTLNFSLSTNITQNITVNLSSSVAKISSNVETTPSAIQTVEKTVEEPLPSSECTVDAIVEEEKDCTQRLPEPKPFVFHLPKKQLIDNSNLNLDDSDNDDLAIIEEMKKKKLEALIQENMEEMKTLEEPAKAPQKKEENVMQQVLQVAKETEEKLKPAPKQETKRQHSPRRAQAHKPLPIRRKARSPSPRKRNLSPRRRFSPRRRRRSPSLRRRLSSPRRTVRAKSPRRRRSISPRKKSPRKRTPSPKRKEKEKERVKERPKSPKRNVPDSTISDDLLSQNTLAHNEEYKESPQQRAFGKFQEPPRYDSPKRVPLDVRINQVLGIETSAPPPPIQNSPVSVSVPPPPIQNPSVSVGYAFNAAKQYQQTQYVQQKSVFPQSVPAFDIPMPSTSKAPPPKPKPLPQNIVQVGNIMEINPTVDFSRVEPPKAQPMYKEIPREIRMASFKQVGNVLQIVPTEHFPQPEILPAPPPKVEAPAVPAVIKAESPDVPNLEKQSAEQTMKQKVAERRAEREKRRLERDQRRREKERRRKEREKIKQQKLKIRTENMIKKALEMEEAEGNSTLNESVTDTPAQWPPLNFVVVHNATKEAGKSILVKGGARRDETDTERKPKSVQFADGVRPGEGTSPSGGEELSSPPPQRKKIPKEKMYQKGKYQKKKVKVKIIRKKKKEEESDEDDNLPPPSPPPGSPPPHLWPPRVKPQPVQPQIQPTYITNIPNIPQYQALYRPPIGIIMAPPPMAGPGGPLQPPHPHHVPPHPHHAPPHFPGMMAHPHGFQPPMVPGLVGVPHHQLPHGPPLPGLLGHLGGPPPPPPPPLAGPSGLGHHHGHPSHSGYGRHHY